ncbi:hypothetical protein DBR32_08235 [Taibaiella sp. KBW10]|uniref:Omp28-related outer membrane protein n=1 Tax=Taibaiella sp. KBW10 TaxID=2153357 RepID=UPI000F593BA0|nr:Omp28-related outer membrane protein [Taibaiella sp. KBW10]RQO30708.1 hypothetical protein DBR32_08235 [Taibaiella sp. KBW10]
MKKLIFTFLCAGAVATTQAQTPEMKSRSLVCKFTETWCGPCGSWGWNLANQVIPDLGDNGFYVGVMGSSTPATMNANCYNAFESNFPIGGYPTFIVNNDDGGTSFSGVRALYNNFAATTAVASPAAYFNISGTTLTVNAKSKFWTATSGEYYLSAFVVEDKVLATQNGQSGTVEHHYLLRGSMLDNHSPWGVQLANGSVNANAEYSQDFTMTLASGWRTDNISVLLVIYKKEGTKYKFVNAAKAGASPTSVNHKTILSGISVFPNPSSSTANLALSLTDSRKLSLKVTDMTGRVVYSQSARYFAAGTNNVSIPVQMLAGGTYQVSVMGEGIYGNTSLVVSK